MPCLISFQNNFEETVEMTSSKKLILILSICIIALTSGCSYLGMNTIPMDQLKAKYADSESEIIQIDDMNIHYKDEGQGPVLILLHGVCASLHTWDGWTQRMKDRYRIIRLDIPGFGLTGPPPDPSLNTKEGAVGLFEKVVDEMKLDKFFLAGNSLGGYIAWNYALKHPEKVEKMILVDSVGFPQPLPWIIDFASTPIVAPFAKHVMPKFLIDICVNQVFGDKSKVTDQLKDRYFELMMREGNKGGTVDVFKEFRKMCDNEKLSEGIKNLKPPTLVMWGTEDTWTPFNTSFSKWKQELPTARFIHYEGAGHTPMEELPDETARDADLFLSGKL